MRYRKLEFYQVPAKYREYYKAFSVKVGDDYYLCLNGSVEDLKQHLVELTLDGKPICDAGYGLINKKL
jgi:hypothetical protein